MGQGCDETLGVCVNAGFLISRSRSCYKVTISSCNAPIECLSSYLIIMRTLLPSLQFAKPTKASKA